MFKTIKSTELVYSAMIIHIVEEHKHNLLLLLLSTVTQHYRYSKLV